MLILADDLGWADLACYGADLHETPHLDRLARQGMRFTNAYSASVCSPTRASLMTGKHYARLHMTTWYEASQSPPRDRRLIPPVTVGNLPHRELTIAKRAQRAGYLTALVGKWHLGDAAYYPETHGFDINIGGTFWGAPYSYFFPYRGSGRFEGEFRYVPHLEGGRSGEYLTDRLTDEALRIIDTAGDRPFFLYLAHHAVHTPIEAKADLVKHYEAKLTDGLRHKNAKYAAMVHSLDESVGRVMDRLEENHLADHTLVIFLSDNGGHIGQFDALNCTNNSPLRSGKGSLYEGGVRVPLIVRYPGTTSPASVCHEPVFCADWHSTIAEVAGLTDVPAPAAPLDGQSLVPLLKKPDATLSREALFFHYPHYYPTTTPASAVRAGDWKLIEYLEDGRAELYNLRQDPSEQHDLAAERPAKTAELRDMLHGWRTRTAVQMPTPNPHFRTERP
ncbi:MAG: sulfatase [Planctomycetia bacterium]|nr:sulfatase [Planctomycetia bacterium]